MKNLKILSVLIPCLVFTACINGQIRKTVYGNHKVVKEDRSTGSFTGIRVGTGIDVYLRQGDSESVAVETDENIQEYIRTEVKGDVLNVYADANIRDTKLKNVYVTMKEVRSLETSSAGDIIGQSPIKSENLRLSASSAGDIKLEVTAKSIELDISSSGNITLNGGADRLDATLSSAGDLNAFELPVKEADVSVSSAGDADVTVTEKLTARASSAGGINYQGDPKYVDAHSSSAGGIHKR